MVKGQGQTAGLWLNVFSLDPFAWKWPYLVQLMSLVSIWPLLILKSHAQRSRSNCKSMIKFCLLNISWPLCLKVTKLGTVDAFSKYLLCLFIIKVVNNEFYRTNFFLLFLKCRIKKTIDEKCITAGANFIFYHGYLWACSFHLRCCNSVVYNCMNYWLIQAYQEIPNLTDCSHLHQIRGDNYCGIRGTLLQCFIQNINVLSKWSSAESVINRLQTLYRNPNSGLSQWTFAHRLPFNKKDKLPTMSECVQCLFLKVNMEKLCCYFSFG